MKFYKCDVCGKVIDERDYNAEYGNRKRSRSGLFGAILQDMDVCGKCMAVGKNMDVEKIFIQEWTIAAADRPVCYGAEENTAVDDRKEESAE